MWYIYIILIFISSLAFLLTFSNCIVLSYKKIYLRVLYIFDKVYHTSVKDLKMKEKVHFEEGGGLLKIIAIHKNKSPYLGSVDKFYNGLKS